MEGPVLLTGASGRVGAAILEGIGDQYTWRLLDRQPPPTEYPGETVVADVTDREAITAAVDGVTAIIHLAGDPRKDAPWQSVLSNNIHGTQLLYQAAAEAGVDRIAFASSNHVVGGYETPSRLPELYQADGDCLLDGTESPRPGNLYGVSKAAGELLGRYYHDTAGLSVVNVRIGNLTADHPPANYPRGRAMWLSHRDCAQLFKRCLEADYDYGTVYGISANDQRFYSLTPARSMLGYEPQDNAAEYHVDGTPK